MTEGQRPGETAQSFGNSLTAEFVEERKTLEQLAGFFSDHRIDLCRGDTGGRQKREVDLNAGSHGDRAVRLGFDRALLNRFEVDLQAERWLRPNRSVQLQPLGRTDCVAIHRNL